MKVQLWNFGLDHALDSLVPQYLRWSTEGAFKTNRLSTSSLAFSSGRYLNWNLVSWLLSSLCCRLWNLQQEAAAQQQLTSFSALTLVKHVELEGRVKSRPNCGKSDTFWRLRPQKIMFSKKIRSRAHSSKNIGCFRYWRLCWPQLL